MNVGQRAAECAGNWGEFDSFAWHKKPDDAHDWYIWYTHNRDSGLLEQSNAEQIGKAFEPFIDRGNVVAEHHRRWAVGWVASWSIRVYNNDGAITPAFIKCAELLDSLEQYLVLDEDHFAELEYEAALDNIQQGGQDAGIDDNLLPREWEYRVFEWLWDNEQGELEAGEHGAYPSTEAIERAVKALFDLEVESC